MDFDDRSMPVGDLADWQELTPTHYRFTLKPNREPFHNGRPVTARDVAATYQSLLALRNSPHTAEFANISRIEVVDDETVGSEERREGKECVSRGSVGWGLDNEKKKQNKNKKKK